jgi:hypothetical protein
MAIGAPTATLIAAVVGFFSGASVALIQVQYQRSQERKSLKAALAAEIRAILSIVEGRDYIADLEKFIASIDANDLYQVRIARDYDIVFRSNCNKIGLLPADLSERVVRFYYLIASAIEDIRLLVDANASPELRFACRLDTAEGNRIFHQNLLDISRQAIARGSTLATELAGPNRREYVRDRNRTS